MKQAYIKRKGKRYRYHGWVRYKYLAKEYPGYDLIVIYGLSSGDFGRKRVKGWKVYYRKTK